MLKSQHILSFNFPIPLHNSNRCHNHSFLSPPLAHTPLRTDRLRLRLAAEPTTNAAPSPQKQQQQEEGPVELFPSSTPVFSTDDDPSEIQIATSVLLTGAISIFLFRSLRRRARRAKELLAINSIMEEPKDKTTETKGEEKLGSTDSTVESPTNTSDKSNENQSSED